ncbi:MAG: Cif family virulence factor [Planctomycetota bacterium]|jgi:ketosteroid isomerase-like protein
MSVVAKYCEECGLKIPQEHFEDGRAISYLYLSYCENCKKKVEKLYNAFQEFASFEAAEEKKGFIYHLLVIVVVTVIGAVLTFFGTRYFVKSSAQKQIDAKQIAMDKLTKAKKGEIDKLNVELQKHKNQIHILKTEGGAPGEIKELREKYNKQKEDFDRLKVAHNGAIRDRDAERDRANNAERLRDEYEKIANDKGVGDAIKLRKENESLRTQLTKTKKQLADAQEEIDKLEREGATPKHMQDKLVRLEISQIILAWAHAVNNHDAPTVKNLYSRDSAFGKDSILRINQMLAQNDVTVGVKIKKINVDTNVATADIDVEYRADSITGNPRAVRMTLAKESNNWKIKDEGF